MSLSLQGAWIEILLIAFLSSIGGKEWREHTPPCFTPMPFPRFGVSALATGGIIIANGQRFRKPDFQPKFRLTHNICVKFEKSVCKSERAFTYLRNFQIYRCFSQFFSCFLCISHLSYETVKKIPLQCYQHQSGTGY